MTHPRPIITLAALLLLTACAQTPQQPGARTRLNAPTPRNEPTTTRAADTGIPLLIDGNPVTWNTLRPLLAEAAGAEIVEELALEQALKARLRAQGITIGETETNAARESWLAFLEQAGVSSETEAAVRARRGLGEHRFRSLLWRNAALRALLDQADTEVTDREIALATEIRAGRRHRVTGVIAPDAQTALSIRAAINADPAGPSAGLWNSALRADLAPFQATISPIDPAYPESIRRTLPALEPLTPSTVIAIDRGYAIVLIDATLEPLEGDQHPDPAALRRELTIRKTRTAMERLARELTDRAEVTKLDPTLD